MKERNYKDYENFFTWLFNEPKHILYETDTGLLLLQFIVLKNLLILLTK